MSYTYCTKRERAVEVASLGAHVFSVTWAMGFEDALAEAERDVDAYLQYADDWDTMCWESRQLLEDADVWAASLVDAEGAV